MKDPRAFKDYLVKNLSMQVNTVDSLLASSFSFAKVSIVHLSQVIKIWKMIFSSHWS